MTRRVADLNWLMRQPVHNGRTDVQPKKWALMPDLKGGEVMALALRKHGYGQKEIARRIGVNQSIVANFFARLGLPRRNPLASERARQARFKLTFDEWVLDTIEWAKRKVAKAEARNARKEFIGPRMPKYWRNVTVSRERARKNAKALWLAKRHDPVFALKHLVRSRIYNALVRNHAIKSARTRELLGCDMPTLRAHLEAQFKDGMSWQNRSEWHIDHVRPLASFDLNDPVQQRAAFHYTNLQPLWGVENRRKSSKWGEGKRIQRKWSTPRRRVNSSLSQPRSAGS